MIAKYCTREHESAWRGNKSRNSMHIFANVTGQKQE
jgi:hypothetical protein